MELFLPDQIALNDASHAMLSDVEETARRVREYRPLPPDVVRRIENGLLGERVYSTNAIEGSTLDLRETLTVLHTGRILENKKREAIEARNLGEAVRRVAEIVPERRNAHTVERLLDVHKLILRETPDEYWGGRFREHGVIIDGAKYQPPDQVVVPTLVERMMEQLGRREELPGVLRASWAHWALTRIHPFKDGNGRIARLWQDLVLFQSELTCAVIRPEERRDYLDALTGADEGEFNSLVQLVAQRVLITFDKYLAEITADKEIETFAREIAGEADARIDDKRKLAYQRWARKMEQLRWEFDVCASRITAAASRVRIQLRKYEIIDQTKWENIRSGASASQNWFFTLNFDSGDRRRRYIFFFGKHYPTDEDNQHERSENRVCILISEDDGSGQATRLDKLAGCPISTRELFLVDDSFVVRRHDRDTDAARYERGVAPLRIAQDFIREVVLHRLT